MPSPLLWTHETLTPGEQKILGIRWDVDSDCLVVNVQDIAQLANELQPTKRNEVSTVRRFSDPMGFLTPVVIRFKVLFQRLCRAKIDWDQPLTGELLREWSSLVSDLQEGTSYSIPRHLFSGCAHTPTSCRLHRFSDASKTAYAAVVYITFETPNGTSVRFVSSKSPSAAPLQGLSIPCLELMSALLLSRLVDSIHPLLANELELLPPICYTDSKVALYWIYR